MSTRRAHVPPSRGTQPSGVGTSGGRCPGCPSVDDGRRDPLTARRGETHRRLDDRAALHRQRCTLHLPPPTSSRAPRAPPSFAGVLDNSKFELGFFGLCGFFVGL